MCGLAGIISFKPQDTSEATINSMIRALDHRGPDYRAKWQGAFKNKSIAIAHCRLSIIDLNPRANQPFWSTDNNLCLLYNGEIFNYLEVRQDLLGKGVKFRTESDTEVLLEAYKFWGFECISRFRGMWAFVILDFNSGKAVFSRDHFGIKPLYYFASNDKLIFASEIKAILSSGLIPINPNKQKITAFIESGSLGYGMNAESFFEKIYRLEPGMLMHFNLYEETISLKFEETKMATAHPPSFKKAQDWIDATRTEFETSIKLRLRSDVPIGCSLSGGIDSPAVAMLSAKSKADLKTFSCVYKDPLMDERFFIDLVIKKIKSTHYSITYEDTLNEMALLKMLKTQDEPVHTPSIMSQYLVYQKMSREGIRVSLDGQGGDEVFAGYDHCLVIYYLSLIQKKERAKFFFAYGPLLFTKYILWREITRKLWTQRYPPRGGLRHQLKKDIQRYTLPSALRYTDMNSMAHSIESRPPFLDQVLYDLSLKIPESLLVKDGWTKYIMRLSLKGLLPPKVIWNPRKVGFWRDKAIPEIRYMNKFFKEYFSQHASNCFEEKEPVSLLASNTGFELHEHKIWRLFSVLVWENEVLRSYNHS